MHIEVSSLQKRRMSDAGSRMRDQLEFGWLSSAPEEAAGAAADLSRDLDAQVRAFCAELEAKHGVTKRGKMKRGKTRRVGKTKRAKGGKTRRR